jgi:serine/threonine protein phosphatase PrpC
MKDARKGSIIVGSTYLRRRSMDNPFTRERLELLVNQMTLKKNGGNTLFLRNFDNGPSYDGEMTLITKDSQSIKKKIKINECTKPGCSGPGIVKTNQDAYFVKQNFLNNKEYYFIGVCDGHGEQGQAVSQYVANKLPSYITDLSNETITNAFKRVNKEIYANSRMDSNMSGTTVVSIVMTPNNIICINLGDSRAALYKYDNGIYYCKNLSRDHKPCEADETKRIVNSGGRIKKCYDEEHKRFIGPDRVWMKTKEEPGLAMTRSLGDKIAHNIGVIDEPEFKTFTYDGTEKFIIVASDGLWEYVTGDQCISIVKNLYEEGLDSREAAFALTREAFRRWKRKEVAIDDITVVVIFFD